MLELATSVDPVLFTTIGAEIAAAPAVSDWLMPIGPIMPIWF